MKKYIAITYPESQNLMKIKNWYNHCYLMSDIDEEGIKTFGPCTYFVEEDWYNENFINNEDIENKIELSAEEFADIK